MPSGSILTKGDEEARQQADKLRATVEARAKEKGISLAKALLEIQSEGHFSAMNADRDRRLLNIQTQATGSKGWGRDRLARLVGEKQRELLSRDRELTELAAFRKATDLVLREDPALLSDYRRDVETI